MVSGRSESQKHLCFMHFVRAKRPLVAAGRHARTLGEKAGLEVNVEEGRLKVVDGSEEEHKDEGGEQTADDGAHGLGRRQLPAENLQACRQQQRERRRDEHGRLGRRVPAGVGWGFVRGCGRGLGRVRSGKKSSSSRGKSGQQCEGKRSPLARRRVGEWLSRRRKALIEKKVEFSEEKE